MGVRGVYTYTSGGWEGGGLRGVGVTGARAIYVRLHNPDYKGRDRGREGEGRADRVRGLEGRGY